MSRKARVLVVDDDAVVRKSCERILGEAREVYLVENGHEGMSLLS